MKISKRNGKDSFCNSFKNNTFSITREEFVDVVMKAYISVSKKYKLTMEKTPFNDIDDINDDYKLRILGAKELKLIQGDENGNFNPKKNITRAETTVVIKRLAGY